MSQFLLFPTNENGLILDQDLRSELLLLANPPFVYNDFFIYSHGWWTDASRAMSEYNRFSVEFTRLVRTQAGPGARPALGVGIHWPSMLSEDTDSIANYLEAISFYTMEKRADSVGEHGGFTLLQTLLTQLATRNDAFRIHLIGHSFGCKVVCSTLQEIAATDQTVASKALINVVLLQAAFDNNAFDAGECYGSILNKFVNIRLLISKSTKDKALQEAYPKAHRLANLFGTVNPALGAVGPNASLQGKFNDSAATVSVDVGFRADSVPKGKRLLVADLSPLHTNDRYEADEFSGHHSDIFQTEVYSLLYGFLF